jgi:hypothetical protein
VKRGRRRENVSPPVESINKSTAKKSVKPVLVVVTPRTRSAMRKCSAKLDLTNLAINTEGEEEEEENKVMPIKRRLRTRKTKRQPLAKLRSHTNLGPVLTDDESEEEEEVTPIKRRLRKRVE